MAAAPARTVSDSVAISLYDQKVSGGATVLWVNWKTFGHGCDHTLLSFQNSVTSKNTTLYIYIIYIMYIIY